MPSYVAKFEIIKWLFSFSTLPDFFYRFSHLKEESIVVLSCWSLLSKFLPVFSYVSFLVFYSLFSLYVEFAVFLWLACIYSISFF